jgi:tetratricopeptide (TPR) repeat protein
LTPQEQATLSRARTIKPEAQDAYLKGLDYLNQGINAIPEEETKALCEKSFSYFQQAISIEPDYAEAYAALATSYHWLASCDLPEYYPKSKDAALKSISLDETNPAAHGALAFVLWSYDWDAAGSEKEYKRAIELDHNTGYRHGYALLLHSLGRYEEAIREMKLAEAIDPLELLIKLQMGHIYASSHQHDRAIERFTSLIDLHPTYFPAREGLAEVYSDKGMHEQALAEMHRYVELSKVNPTTNINLAWFYAKAGRGNEALRIVEAFNKLPRSGLGSSMFEVAKVYAALGDKEQAFTWLEKAFAARGDSLQLLTVDAYWGNMRSDARFQDLMRRRGLTP